MEKTWMVLAGLAHFGLVAVGAQVPRVFRLRETLAPLGAAPRRLIWTWGAFIVLANVGFGALSLAYAGELAQGKGIAGGFALFIGVYWLARLGCQYLAFNTEDWPKDGGTIAKHGLGALFLGMALVYIAAFAAGEGDMSGFERMVLGVGLVYLVMKALTFRRLAPARALGYLALWPGMDAGPFARSAPAAGSGLIAWGAFKMAIGAGLLIARTGIPALDVVRVFAGIGLLVHFGLCDVLAGCWRRCGVPVERLFVNPAAARTLGEFWGRRWNLAFHAVARDFIFRPVARRRGAAAGILATFLFSGLLHELLLSVPAGGGYGLPTAYFVLQGLLVLVERAGRFGGRIWTLFWVLAPAPLLFHPPFLRGFILPLT